MTANCDPAERAAMEVERRRREVARLRDLPPPAPDDAEGWRRMIDEDNDV